MNENTFINDLNHSLNVTYDFDLDNLNWFQSNKERNFGTESNIALSLTNLLKLSNINLKNFQQKLFEIYEQSNEKLTTELENYLLQKEKQKKQSHHKRYYFNALKFYFDVHFSSLRKYLGTIQKIYEQIEENYFV